MVELLHGWVNYSHVDVLLVIISQVAIFIAQGKVEMGAQPTQAIIDLVDLLSFNVDRSGLISVGGSGSTAILHSQSSIEWYAGGIFDRGDDLSQRRCFLHRC